MKEILRIFANNQFEDIDLTGVSSLTIGNYEKCDVGISIMSRQGKLADFNRAKNGVTLRFPSAVTYRGTQITTVNPENGDTFIFDKRTSEFMKYMLIGDQYTQAISLENCSEISIGREVGSGITLADNNVSRHHATLLKIGEAWTLRDENSTNGTYLNRKKINSSPLWDGAVITISVYTLVFKNNQIYISGDKDISINIRRIKQKKSWEYPVFHCSPRIKDAKKSENLEIQPPPQIGSKPTISWLSVLLPPIVMTIATVLMSVVMNSKTMFFMLPMTLISVVVSIINYRGQVKHFESEELLRFSRYDEHINDIEKAAQRNISGYHDIANNAFPSASETIDFARTQNRRLWERQTADEDFMKIRVGSGVLPADFTISIPSERIELYDDVLKKRPKEIAEKYKMVSDMPITVDLFHRPICGIVGNRKDELQLVKNMIVSITSAHPYTDVKLAIIFDKNEKKDWMWTRWLPHVFDNERSERYMACTRQEAEDLMKSMSEILGSRTQKHNDNLFGQSGREFPFYLFVIADCDIANGVQGMKYLLSADSSSNTAVIFMGDHIERLPAQCMDIIDVNNGNGVIYNRENSSERSMFNIEHISDDNFNKFARYIAPIRLNIASEEIQLPGVVTFFEGYGLNTVNDIDISANWSRNPQRDNMGVPIGICSNGDRFFFNIRTQGPHGLVAGMTGSGKSEMVQSWILSMALAFSPDDVSFVLIDFKGSGLLLPFEKLPHLAGKISDMDKTVSRNMIALDSEIQRRKMLFDKAKVQNIGEYISKSQTDDNIEKLSYLFVIIDEFAELKVKFPEFMELINSMFGIGRTLGISIILMSQKPTGVISDKMRANANFSWCLKVKEAADSKEMLQRSDAVKIVNPGRAYVKVGEFEVYEQIQSFWSGAPYIPNRSDDLKVVPQISTLNLRGERTSYEIKTFDDKKISGRKEIQVLVDYIADTAEKNHFKSARKIWVDKLENIIYLEDIIGSEPYNGITAVVGMVDAPELQTQYPLKLNMDEAGHVALYGAPGTGKTTFLKSYIMSLILQYEASYVNIYIMDFGGMQMGIFKDYPHIGGIANSDDFEKVEKLTGLIMKELKQSRSRKFGGV